MKKSICNRFVSAFVASVMLFTSNAMPISFLPVFVIAEDVPVKGIGIHNHVMGENNAQTTYKITFKDVNGIPVTWADGLPREIDFDTKTMTLDNNGTAVITLDKEQQLDFSKNDTFNNLVKQYQVAIIEIEYQQGVVSGKDTSLLYSQATQTYNFVITDSETNEKHSILDYTAANPFPETVLNSQSLMKYESTLLTEFTVEQDWRDRGAGRPNNENITFDVKQNNNIIISGMGTAVEGNGNLYSYNVTTNNLSYPTYREIEVKDSNTVLYHYTVPEYDASETKYTYTSVQTFDFTTDDYKDKFKTEATGEADKYLAVGLRDFSFSMNWADAYDNSARPTIDAQYIREKFTFYKKVDKYDENNEHITKELVTLGDKDIIVDVYNITIKGLEDINENGTANEYYIELKNTSAGQRLDTASAWTANEDNMRDYYAVKSENEGLHVNETDKTYENGVIDLRLTGTTDFTGNVVWKDKAEEELRRNDEAAASVQTISGTVFYDGNDLKADSAILSIAPDGNATVTFKNELTNYEKLSHVDSETNNFNGYKAIEVSDKYNLVLDTQVANSQDYSVTIGKSELIPMLIKSDGTTTPIQDTGDVKMLKDLVISIPQTIPTTKGHL